jgi:hypothetical protein
MEQTWSAVADQAAGTLRNSLLKTLNGRVTPDAGWRMVLNAGVIQYPGG